MATRDTIINIVDRKTGHTARIRVPSATLERALSEDYDPRTALPSPAVRGARDHICIQAKEALAKKGRLQRYVAWADIVDSVLVSDRITPRGMKPTSAPAAAGAEVTDEPKQGFGQMRLFDAAQALF